MGMSPEFINALADTLLFLPGDFSFLHFSALLSNGLGQLKNGLFLT